MRCASLLLALLTACGSDDPIERDADVEDATNDAREDTSVADACASCDDIAATLDGLRWELPCLMETTPELCTTADEPVVVSATLEGTTGATYEVALRVRGIVEPKTYTGGTTDGSWNEGGTPASDTANIYRLTISAPAQTYYVNAGVTRASNALYCETVDERRTVVVAAGATVTLEADPLDALQIRNIDAEGDPFVIDDVPPAPSAYDGQFVQLDVESIVAR